LRLKRTLSHIPSSNKLEHQMSVLDTKLSVTLLVSPSEQVLLPNEDDVCLSQRARSRILILIILILIILKITF
jgi:hypothetical protein